MAWTTPPTWSTSQLVTATQMQVLSDDLSYLLNRPGSSVLRDNTASYTTTSTSFVDTDATNLKITMTTVSPVVEVGFVGSAKHNAVAGNFVCFDIDVDGTRYASASTDGIATSYVVDVYTNVSFVVRIPGLSAGSHTLKLKWRVSGGTGTLLSGAGGAADAFCSFWAQEVA